MQLVDQGGGDNLIEKGRISSRQLAMLLFTLVISTVDVYLPAVVAGVAGRDAWITVILAVLYAFIIWAVAIGLASRFPRQTVIHYSKEVLGPILGGFIGLLLIIFFFFVGASVTRMLADVMVTAFMPSTPLVVFTTSVMLVASYAVFSGLEVIARVNEIMLPLGLAALIFVGFGSLPQVDFGRYLPLMERGLGPVNWGSIILVSTVAEIVIVLMLYPYINGQTRVGVNGLWVLLGLGAAMQIGVLAIGLFTAEVTAAMNFPALEMVRAIRLGAFMTHLDVVIVAVWVGGIFLKLALLYYVVTLGLAQWLGLSSYQPLLAPVGIWMVIYSLFAYHSIADFWALELKVFPGYSLFHTFLIPLFLLVVAWVRGWGAKG
ncbi:endospore germination permease [Desulfofundulus sp. TPOSR]|uniref:GerAB/ArcD/ProY family transporter n=1 Tax=Desulfofundulus sp. TPOSR TaxID=2714340 RepID=UPI00140A98A9|nr:endospore germination permease [Desulfofundulus sp. TPOSR]NHM27557.1 endospore germination permease [Desulfofundulus sp. TPOSR]